MAGLITIDLRSPERAWEPFMAWMREQGMEPGDARAVTVDPDTMTAEVTVMKGSPGKRRIDHATNEVAIEVCRRPVSSLPPLRRRVA